jgi:hypothetical protein
MAERLHLLLDGSHDLRMLMPGIDHGNASAEVDAIQPNLPSGVSVVVSYS